MTHIFKGIYNLVIKPWNRLIFIKKNVKYEGFPRINGPLSIRGKGRLLIGKYVTINSSYNSNPVGNGHKTAFFISPGAEIILGNNVGISNSLFYSRKKIVINDNVLIGGGCQIYDTDFHSLRYDDRILKGDKEVKCSPVIIKEGAFIGASSIILKGVTIGERSVVAAGSVVTRNIPSNEIWGGNPACFIRKI